MAQPQDWIGELIENEVRSVIAWKRAAEQFPEVKADHEDRFSDDGSNFRSAIISSSFSADSKVQISIIISTDDPVTLFITDGFIRVKAKLSDKALAKLEDGIGGKIDSNLKGDILHIREATVESTPYGPADGFIQVVIDDLDYLFHIRKSLGTPVAIEDRPEIQRLIREIETLRCPPEAGSQTFTPRASSKQRNADTPQTNPVPQESTLGETPKSQRSLRLSQSNSPSLLQSPSTQRALATQIPARLKPTGPTLDSDGLEMEDGVNLSRPVGRRVEHVSNNVSKPSAVTSETSKQLLSLLGKRKAEPAAEPAQTLQSQLPSAENFAPAESPIIRPSAELDTTAGAAQSKNNAPKTRHRTNYRTQKVPRDQQKLLDRPSSWLPSLPGQQFPHPNVPIELLNRWKSQASIVIAKEVPSATHLAEPYEPVGDEQPQERAQTSDSSSSESFSEDEEIPASQWPSSPEQERPLLPPDSSIGQNSRPSTADKQMELPPSDSKHAENKQKQAPRNSAASGSPHSTPAIGIRSPPTQTQRKDGLINSSPVSIKAPIPLGPRPTLIPLTNPITAAARRTSSGPISNLDGNKSRPSTSEGPPRASTHAGGIATSAKSSSQDVQSSMRSPPNLSGTVVKATQASRDEDDDGLEMAVPRSLGQDPALAHRKRRREYLQAAQRRSWITKNLEPTSEKPLSFISIFSAYRKAHEKDAVKASEFADAVEEVFPSEDGEPVRLRFRPSELSRNVQSSPAKLQGTPTTDTNGAVATSEPRPSGQAVTEKPLKPSQTRRSLPWVDSTLTTPNTALRVSGTKAAPASTAPVNYGIRSRVPLAQNSAGTGVGIDKSYDRPGERVQTMHSPSIYTTPRPAAPISIPNLGRSGLLSQPHRPRAQATNNASKAGQTRAITTSTTNNRNSIREPAVDPMDIDEPSRKEGSVSVFAEFSKAYRALEPGGAFAGTQVPKGAREKGKVKASRLNVLSWKL